MTKVRAGQHTSDDSGEGKQTKGEPGRGTETSETLSTRSEGKNKKKKSDNRSSTSAPRGLHPAPLEKKRSKGLSSGSNKRETEHAAHPGLRSKQTRDQHSPMTSGGTPTTA